MTWLEPAEEMRGVALGDKRLDARAVALMRALQKSPASHFPMLFSRSGLEAFYRFTNNEAVEVASLLRPHNQASWERAAGGPLRIVVHDTTDFSFPGEKARSGLPRVGNKSVFFSHVSVLVGLEEAPVVHGVVGMRNYVVEDGMWTEEAAEEGDAQLDCGSARWHDAVTASKKESPPGPPVVHVMDREADDYSLLHTVLAQGDHLVCRSNQNRRVAGSAGYLEKVLEKSPFLLQRTVWISRRAGLRPPKALKSHPEREARATHLSVRAGPVVVQRPVKTRDRTLPPSLALNLVEVIEVNPPLGEEPVHWRLYTTLPVSTSAEVALVVDIYRKRWLIEEYFKALKTGCAVEARQAESLGALLRTVALLVPIAVRLLNLRTVARHAPEVPAGELFDSIEIAAMNHLLPAAKKLPANASAQQAMAAVATLGGHLKHNGAPGWMVLARGYLKLLSFAEGWRAAIAAVTGNSAAGSLTEAFTVEGK